MKSGAGCGNGTSLRLFILLTILLVNFSSPEVLSANGYSQPGLYTPERILLENGLELILKPRGEARNVSIRIVVGVGHDDFRKGKKHAPHLLEHLSFTGTSKHNEAALEKMVKEHGGAWNATTSNTQTVYELDIYSDHALWGIELLYEILTDSTYTPENFELTREIIHRENGGRSSAAKRWLYDHDVGKFPSVMAGEALTNNDAYFLGLENCDAITRDDILQLYKTFYVPANLQIIVVGLFDRDQVLGRIKSSFGTLAKAPPPGRINWDLPFPEKARVFNGTFAPIIDTEAFAGLFFRTDGRLNGDHYPLIVVAEYLDRKIMEELRIKRGWAYSPEASFYALDHWGVFGIGGDVDFDKLDGTLEIIRQETEKVVSGKVPVAEIEKTRTGILLRLANGYETNAGIAELYAGAIAELKTYGKFINHEVRIEAVTPDQFFAAAQKYLDMNKVMIVRSLPTLTIEQLVILIGGLVVALTLFLWLRFRNLKRKNRV
ncbi:MAG: insulinase family protein [Proteobacteria bacterium]|nr:insulinase family protein [Pseudomonadota bacterium]MBU1739384.1 insulinase family protein [Pseudomonadota bacterium]